MSRDDSLHASHPFLQAEIESLHLQNQRLETEKIELQGSIQSLKFQYNVLEEKTSYLLREIRGRDEELDRLQRELKSYALKEEKWKTELEQQHIKIIENEKRMEAMRQEEKIKLQIQEKKEAQEQLTFRTLKEEKSELNIQFLQYKAEVQNILQENTIALIHKEEELSSLKEDMQRLTKKLEETETQRKEEKLQNEELNVQLAKSIGVLNEREEGYQRLVKQYSDLQENHASEKVTFEKLQRQYEETIQTLEEEKKTSKVMFDEVKLKETKAKENEARLMELETMLNEKEKQIHSQQSLVTEYTTEIDRIQKQMYNVKIEKISSSRKLRQNALLGKVFLLWFYVYPAIERSEKEMIQNEHLSFILEDYTEIIVRLREEVLYWKQELSNTQLSCSEMKNQMIKNTEKTEDLHQENSMEIATLKLNLLRLNEKFMQCKRQQKVTETNDRNNRLLFKEKCWKRLEHCKHYAAQLLVHQKKKYIQLQIFLEWRLLLRQHYRTTAPSPVYIAESPCKFIKPTDTHDYASSKYSDDQLIDTHSVNSSSVRSSKIPSINDRYPSDIFSSSLANGSISGINSTTNNNNSRLLRSYEKSRRCSACTHTSLEIKL